MSPVLNTADKLYVGTSPVAAVYAGTNKVWPTRFVPTQLAGLNVWLDAADYTVGVWPNKGSGPAVTIAGTPAMAVSANTLKGLPLVRFKTNEGRVRSPWTGSNGVYDYTLIYLIRWVAPGGVGRAFSIQYPPSNYLVGFHSSAKDAMYDNGSWVYGADQSWASWNPPPGPWRMYGADQTAGQVSRFFIDGVGSPSTTTSGGGWTGGWALSGYGADTTETMDFEMAELVIYDRKLPDADRQTVENYLRSKWL